MSITKLFQIFLFLLILTYTSGQDNGSAPATPDSYGFSTPFNPSMAIIMVVIVSAFFIMGFFSIYIRQCTGDHSVSPATGVGARLGRDMKGLDQVVIDAFPTFVYSAVKELKIGKGTLECAVCLNEFEDTETLRLLPKCDHVFHSECIDAWLASHVTCPVCRANLAPGEASSAEQTVTESSDHQQDNQTSQTEIPGGSNQLQIHVAEDETSTSIFSSTTSMLGKFPRSHTTGHSIFQPGRGEDHERFTLRLPADIRKQIILNGKLNRSTSCVSFQAAYEMGGGSSRRGYRGGSMKEGSSRGKTNRFRRLDTNASSDGWVFTMAPPFISRPGARKEDGEASRSSKILSSVKSLKNSMECLPSKDNENHSMELNRPPV